MDKVLELRHLNKKMGKRQILNDINLEVYGGEVFGFLGPNGAGKTTTIKMVVGLLRVDEGDVIICGKNLKRDFEGAIAQIGAIVENPEMYKYMTGMQNLRQYARMRKGVTQEKIDGIIELVGLKNRIHEKVGKYSLGMRQRLGIAQALLGDPKLLILDEPTNGLDPVGIKNLRDLLKDLAHKQGVGVIVSSHLMSEMELMCDRVGIISEGRIIDVKPLEKLLHETSNNMVTYHYHVDHADEVATLIQGLECYQQSEQNSIQILNEHSFVLSCIQDESLDISEVNKAIILSNYALYTVTANENKNLEEVFIQLTEKGGNQIA